MGGKSLTLVLKQSLSIFLWIVLFIYLISGIYTVKHDEQAIVTRFGAIHLENVKPGMHYSLPYPFEKVYKCKVKQEHTLKIVHGIESRIDEVIPEDTEKTQMVTGDTNLIAIQMEVQFRISDSRDFLFSVQNPNRLISKVSESILTEIIGKMSVDSVLTTGKRVVATRFKKKVQKILDSYRCGVLITNAQLANVGAAKKVLDAFNAVSQASSISRTEINRALGYRNTVIPNAYADAERKKQDATSFKDQVIKNAMGEARNFLLQLEKFKMAPIVSKKRLYLEKMKNILGKCRKVIVSSQAKQKINRLRIWVNSD